MTCWFCDRCGKQVRKNSYGAGKYNIQKSFTVEDREGGFVTTFEQRQRYLKFCDECAMTMEAIIDDELIDTTTEPVAKLILEGDNENV